MRNHHEISLRLLEHQHCLYIYKDAHRTRNILCCSYFTQF